jgi:acyl-CoA thioesterase
VVGLRKCPGNTCSLPQTVSTEVMRLQVLRIRPCRSVMFRSEIDVGDDWLGLEHAGGGRSSFELTPHLARSDGKLFGGTAVAVATAAIEAISSRPTLWVTVQFVASAQTSDGIDVHTEVLAAGRRIWQLRVTATCGDSTVFVALGAAGLPRGSALDAHFPEMPEVERPEAFRSRTVLERAPGWYAKTDLIPAKRLNNETGSEQLTVWARLQDSLLTRPVLGLFADMVPAGVARAAGLDGTGISLDNTIRFGTPPSGEWVLVEVVPEMAAAGYCAGEVRLWSSKGQLLAVASQTARLIILD